MEPITPQNVWDIIKRVNKRCFMNNPFFLILHCQYEMHGDDVLVYWRNDRSSLIFAPQDAALVQEKTLWIHQEDIDRLRQQGLEIKKVEPDTKEYFYKTKDLIDLKGKDYKKIRNKINAFKEKYAFEVLEQYPADATKAFITTWYEKHRHSKTGWNLETFDFEYHASLKMIDLLPSLPQVKQLYVTVNGKLAGLTLFCATFDDFWVSEIQKTARHLYAGLSKFLYHEKCKRMSAYAMATFGDDAKDKSLATAKRELRPARIDEYFMVETGTL